MKVSPEHFAILKAAIEPEDTEERRAFYRSRRIARAETVRDINVRYRWDLYYWAAQQYGSGLPDSTQGYTMSHIDTALRKIVPNIE